MPAHSLVRPAQKPETPDLGRQRAALGSPSRACWHLQAQSSYPEFKEMGEGILPGAAAVPTLHILLKPEGLRGLWQLLQPFAVLGRDRSCFSLFQGLRAGEARRSRFQHRGCTTVRAEEEASVLAKATSSLSPFYFPLNNGSTPVY